MNFAAIGDDVSVYGIQPKRSRLRRKWQAEWHGCRVAARGYTRRGALRRAQGWIGGSLLWRLDYMLQRLSWHVFRLPVIRHFV